MVENCRRCHLCRSPLLDEDELDYGICEDCAQAAYERSKEREEWDYYHPDD